MNISALISAVTFVCPEDSEREPIEKKLPGKSAHQTRGTRDGCLRCFLLFSGSMIVQKVKGLLHRLLKLPGVELQLSYTCSKVHHSLSVIYAFIYTSYDLLSCLFLTNIYMINLHCLIIYLSYF